MNLAQAHRGPDADNIWPGPGMALGHRRLSIIDLDRTSDQPFIDHQTGCVLTYNGEIYNYLELRAELESLGHGFQTKGDAEVLLRAYVEWGADCLQRLLGMWAFIIYDPRTDKLFLSRDRFGVKPLHYSFSNEGIFLASEIRGLFASGYVNSQPNYAVAFRYLVDRSVDEGNKTFFESVLRVPPGTYAYIGRAEIGAPKFVSYWSLEELISKDNSLLKLPYRDLVMRFRDLFFDSIAKHLRADVSVGSCLSGGLDSSSIVSVATSLLQTARPTSVNAFSAVFPKTDFDEVEYVDAVVAKAQATSVKITPTDLDFKNEIDQIISLQEEPFGSTGIFVQWKVFQAARLANIKVMLDGQGADEALAGYLTFYIPYVWEELRRGNLWGASAAIWRYLRYNRNRHFLSSNLIPLLRRLRGYRSQSSIPDWMGPLMRTASSCADGLRKQNAPKSKTFGVKDLLIQYLGTNSLPTLLRYEDKNSMHFSIESRVPFLDHRIVEFALSCPANALLKNGETKRLLRDAMRGVVPDAVIDRKDKLGFANPEIAWVREIIAPRLRRMLESGQHSKLILAKPFRRILDDRRLLESRANLVWRVYNLLVWHGGLDASVGDSSG
jgi:asparagine synthase (glutamine-hydrolysing)